MSSKFLVVVAVVLGAIVVYLINTTIKGYEEKANPPTKTFYRASGDIAPGLSVGDALSDSKHLLVPERSLPESFARTMPSAVDDVQMEFTKGRRIERPMKAGEFLEQKHLDPISAADMRLAIPEGEALVTITVNAESSVGYLVAPGDVVDVVVVSTRTDPTVPGGTIIEAKTLLADVKVHAVDNLIGRRDGMPVKPRGSTYGTVTLSASPEDVMKVLAAKLTGKLSLVMKSKSKR